MEHIITVCFFVPLVFNYIFPSPRYNPISNIYQEIMEERLNALKTLNALKNKKYEELSGPELDAI